MDVVIGDVLGNLTLQRILYAVTFGTDGSPLLIVAQGLLFELRLF